MNYVFTNKCKHVYHPCIIVRERFGGKMHKMIIAAFAAWGLFSSPLLAQQGKPIVAIYQMDDVARSGQADVFSRMLETAITSTSKFRVIERERLGKLVGEQGRAKAGLVTTRTPGKIGGFEGADFLIYGSITTVSVSRKADIGATMLGGLFSGSNGSNVSCNNSVATVSIDIKITDADSGEVKYVTRLNETQKSAAACNENAGVDTAVLFRAAADKVAAGLVTAIYPIQIAAVQADGTMVLNYGQGTVQPGATMSVFTKGAVIRDPATGDVIANDETLLGLIQITDVMARFSKAQPASPFSTPAAVGAIVRLSTPSDLQAFKKPKGKR